MLEKIDYLFLVYLNEDFSAKRSKPQRYCLPKGIIENYTIIINGKNCYDQPIGSYIKRYEKIRKLTAGQGEDYATGCLLDYCYTKYHHRLIAIDLSKQKELDADPKAMQQIEFVGNLKNLDGINADGAESMFILTILEKKKKLKFSQGSVKVL